MTPFEIATDNFRGFDYTSPEGSRLAVDDHGSATVVSLWLPGESATKNLAVEVRKNGEIRLGIIFPGTEPVIERYRCISFGDLCNLVKPMAPTSTVDGELPRRMTGDVDPSHPTRTRS